jgi:hypothetical protein
MNNKRQIVYFPYLCLRDTESLKIGRVEIWNFSKKKEGYISDVNLRQRIENILKMNKVGSQLIDDIGVVSIGDTNFRLFNEQEVEEINIARLILFISFLSQNNLNYRNLNIGHQMATSENFDFFIQNFHIDDDFFGESTGIIVKKIIGGYKIGQVEFQAPRFLPEPLSFSLDEDLIRQLLWAKNNKKRLFNKIIKSLEIFSEAYYNSPAVSHNARILLQTAAFEILLDLKNRKDFKDKIEKYCSCPNDKKYIYFFEAGSRKIKEGRTIKGIWADRFYTLRNYIIHGNVVKDDFFGFKKKQAHFYIAVLFFILCIKELINEAQKRKVFYDSIKWDKWRDLSQNVKQGFIYKKDLFRQSLTASRSGRKLLKYFKKSP